MNEYLFIYRGGIPDGPPPSAEQMEGVMKRWTAWFGKLGEEGNLKDWGAPLQREGKRIAAGGSITDGPFTEGKEVVGGYSIIKANDLAHAAQLAQTCPMIVDGGSVEVRAIQPM
jgi:hypothetical protein